MTSIELITRQQFETATLRGKTRRAKLSPVIQASYDARRVRVIIHFRNGLELSFAPHDVEGLTTARPADLRTIQISPSGYGLHFPALDADVYVPGLITGAFGSRQWIAAQLGAVGGNSRSPRKKKAARANGKLGGRPRKTAVS